MMRAEVPEHCAVAIVGGGPAGLAAAAELGARGIGPVVVLEREARAGGIPRHCGHPPFGMREFRRVLRGPDYAARLVARAQAAGARICVGASVTALRPGPALELSTPAGLREIAARVVLLATGLRETSRAARMIGGEKPGGILSTGALQGLVHLEGLRPFARPVVLGSELVAFSALMTCRQGGIRPLAMVEPGPGAVARWPAALLARALGVELLLGTEVIAIHGRDRVTGVELRDAAGATRPLPTDGVIVSGQFLPEATLPRAGHLRLDPGSGGPEVDQFGRCSDPDYFAAGNLLRAVETAGWCWEEGRRAGRAIALSMVGGLPVAGGGARIVTRGDVLKYAVPGRLVAAQGQGGATEQLQLRVRQAAHGRLSLMVEGAEVWGRTISALPERRMTLPLAAMPRGFEGVAEVALREVG